MRSRPGATPEAIVQSYDTLSLADVYAVVSRYLAAPALFEEHLRIRDEAAGEARRKYRGDPGPSGQPARGFAGPREGPGGGAVLKRVSDENFDGVILRGL